MKTEGSLLSALEKRELLLNRIAETEKFAKKQDPYAHKLGMSKGEAGQSAEYRRLLEDKKELAELDKQAQKVLEKNVALIKEQTGIDVGPYFKNFNASLMDWTKLNAQLNKELEAFDNVSKDIKTTPAASALNLGKKKPDGSDGSGGSFTPLSTTEQLDQLAKYTEDLFGSFKLKFDTNGLDQAAEFASKRIGDMMNIRIPEAAFALSTTSNLVQSDPMEDNFGWGDASTFGKSSSVKLGGSASNPDYAARFVSIQEQEIANAKLFLELDSRKIDNLSKYTDEYNEMVTATAERAAEAFIADEEARIASVEAMKEYYIGQGESFLEATQMGIDMLTTLNEAAMQKAEKRHNKEMANLARQKDYSVAMAGESATKKAIIESDFRKMESQLLREKEAEEAEYNRKQKAYAIVNAIINTALAVTKALSSVSPPASYVLAAMSGAMGAVQIASIASQNYRTGGMIDGQGNSTSDSIPIMASRGEYMLNAGTVDAVGGELGVQQMIDSYLGNAPKPGRSYTVYVENAYGHKEFVRELAKELAVEEDRW
jgi:hypothetical protein